MRSDNAALAVIMLVAGAPAAAAPLQRDATAGFSPAYQACIVYGEAHDTAAIPQGECDARELRAQDARLNTAYRTMIARLSPVRKADLRTDERNWIVARDQKCAKALDPDLTTECTIDETIKRIAYLRRYR